VCASAPCTWIRISDDGAPTRKPGIGMLLDYLKSGELDLADSWVIGDRETDLQLAANMGIGGLRLGGEYADWPIAHRLADRPRQATVTRKTRETIRVLSTSTPEQVASRHGPRTGGGNRVHTGIGLFDHMLDQLASHGGFHLELDCRGDLEIDEHHTVEDCALGLGQALNQALGDRRGIGRYGFLLPMDESLAQVAIDLSGRPALAFDADFPRDRVGELSTEMVRHFFASLARRSAPPSTCRSAARTPTTWSRPCSRAPGGPCAPPWPAAAARYPAPRVCCDVACGGR
jgi:imidazoleglycerol-phosphate dehydratase/histidinol-phosphatase